MEIPIGTSIYNTHTHTPQNTNTTNIANKTQRQVALGKARALGGSDHDNSFKGSLRDIPSLAAVSGCSQQEPFNPVLGNFEMAPNTCVSTTGSDTSV